MSDNRTYYYIRIKEDYFDRDEIKIIESMPNGYLYSLILLKLYLKSLKREGKLMVTDKIPYNVETLSKVIGHDIDTVRSALQVFKEFKLIEVLDNGAIFMDDIQNFIGKSSTEGDRKRAYRKRIEAEKKLIKDGQMSDNCPTQNHEALPSNQVNKPKGQMSDKQPPDTEQELETELELEIEQHIEQIVRCTSKESKTIVDICKKYHPTKNVVDVVVEKMEIINSGKFKNKIGALVIAIKDDWQKSNRVDKTCFNNFSGRNYTIDDYKNLEYKLLGWDKEN